MKKMWNSILQALRIRSRCCSAPVVYVFGPNYKGYDDHHACSLCLQHA